MNQFARFCMLLAAVTVAISIVGCSGSNDSEAPTPDAAGDAGSGASDAASDAMNDTRNDMPDDMDEMDIPAMPGSSDSSGNSGNDGGMGNMLSGGASDAMNALGAGNVSDNAKAKWGSYLSKMNELTGVLEQITDGASAESLSGKVRSIIDELKSMKDSLDQLTTQENQAAIMSFGQQLMEAGRGVQTQMARVMANPEARDKLGDAFENMPKK